MLYDFDLLPYLQAFCRFVIGLVFGLSFIGKVKDAYAFEQTIARFDILPTRLNRVSAFLLLSAELLVVITMIIGGSLLIWGFLLAGIILLSFCMALASVMLRKIKTSCNCFGLSEKAVSPFDIIRNLGFVLCALVGYFAAEPNGQAAPSMWGWTFAAIMAGVFMMIWSQIEDVLKILKGI
jgi:hypothetical protein